MRIRDSLRALLVLSLVGLSPAFGEEIRDYYSEPGLNPFKEVLNQSFNEYIDPFSGTLQLKYNDIHVPGNGGMDINLTRTYTSLQTNAYPIRNMNGMGWTMHFGRIVTARDNLGKICNQGSFGTDTSDNASLELPDGGRELLVLNALQNDGTLITRSNWRATCSTNPGYVVTAPDGTRYFMDRFDYFQDEPSWLTSRIEDVHGNWIAIDYATNAVGINYMSAVRRSEDGTVLTFEYEDQDTNGIALSAIIAPGQRWVYQYELIPGYLGGFYKQLVRAVRPDGKVWVYTYNPKMPDPNPNDQYPEDGVASYSMNRVYYPHGAFISYTYQLVNFAPDSPVKTTSIQSKTLSGSGVAGGQWIFDFAPHSQPFDDGQGGQLRHDLTTVTAPGAIYRYVHMGKDFRQGAPGQTIFVRPSFVGSIVSKEVRSKGLNGKVLEATRYVWGERKISEEDFSHGGFYRGWWHDNGTYVPVLLGEYVNRDDHVGGSTFSHGRIFSGHDFFGNPGRVVDHSNIANVPAHQVDYTYVNDTTKWIIGLTKDEIHSKLVGDNDTEVGTVEREYDVNGMLEEIVEFGEETRYTYTYAGDVETVRDARGKITRYYDYKRGIAEREVRPESVTIRRAVNDTGTLRSETNGRGYITRYTYDELNRLESIDYPIKADVSIDYDNGPSGFYKRVLTRGTYRQTEQINDFDEVWRTERYDTATSESVVRTSIFDAHGRDTFESYPNSAQGITKIWDALGRMERSTHADNTFVAYSYDDETAAVTNERGFKTTYLYLIFGTDFAGQDPVMIDEPESVSTTIKRDIWGNVLEVFQGQRVSSTSISGYGKTYLYNDRRLLEESNEPEVGKTIYGHDEVGNVVSERVNKLPAVTFGYDDLNRRTLVDFSDDTPDVVTGYDKNDNVERVTKGNTEVFYVRDENDNVLSERTTINHPQLAPRVYLMGFEYSDLDVMSLTTYPSGLAVDYAPDAFGRATKVGTFATSITYHPSGSLKSYRLANGVVTTTALNQRLLTESITAPGVVNFTYAYDAGANVMRITDGLDATKNVVMNASSYDGLDRLKYATGKWGTATLSYDFHGNLLTKHLGAKGSSYALDSQRRARQIDLHASSSPGSQQGLVRFNFDGRGNAISKRQYTGGFGVYTELNDKTFEYDAASHLVKARVNRVTSSGTTVLSSKDYLYDGNGQRVVEQAHGSYDIRFSIYSGGQLLFEDSLKDCTRTDYIRLGALNIARSDDQLAVPSLDTDGDQIPDCMESVFGLNANFAGDGAGDVDGDGLTNLAEYLAGTALARADTDGDGLSDRDELQRDLTDPTNGDTDGDGIADGTEVANPQLDARNSDRDHDGVSDSWELLLQTNPNNAADGMVDTDGDGFSNRQESGTGADPLLATTTPDRGTQVWSVDMLAASRSSGVIGPDRTFYVVTLDDRIRAFHPDGKQRWSIALNLGSVYEPTVGPDGTVYVVSMATGAPVGQPRSFVTALNSDGTQRWSWGSTDYLRTGVAIGEAGRLYVGGMRINGSSTYRVVTSLAPNGTGPVTSAISGSSFKTTPTVAFNGDVYLVEDTGKLFAFTKNLESRWTYQLRKAADAPPTVADDGTVYVGDQDGYLYAFTSAGALRWERLITAGAQRSGIAIGADGTLYVGAYQGRLMALNPATGATIWDVATNGTTYTPAVAANGNIYATTYAGDLRAFDSTGAQLWRLATASRVSTSPIVDRDGTIYLTSESGQIYVVADNAGGPARSPWPGYRHDSAGANYRCFNEPAFSIVADGDGDGIDDCSELRYGLNPANPADATGDMDGDGLNNREEHQRGTRVDLADTDGDGLSDGLEVLTYHTDPRVTDTDHDTIPDGREVALNTDPLNPVDSALDSDNDGFTNRQESLAGTDPNLGSSRPTDGQVVRDLNTSTVKQVAVASDGTIYQVTANESSATGTLEALYPDFTVKWSVPFPSPVGLAPIVGADGTVYAFKSNEGIYAYRPNGTLQWIHRFVQVGTYGIRTQPAIGADGTIYYVRSPESGGSSTIHAVTRNGAVDPTWQVPSVAAMSRIAVAPNGTVGATGGGYVRLYSSTGSLLWNYFQSGIPSWSINQVVFGTNGTMYAINAGGLSSYDPATGTRLWNKPGTGGHPLIDADNRIIVFCSTSGTNLCAVDANGQTVWAEQSGISFRGSPVIDANGTIIVASVNQLTAFNSDGTTRWSKSLTPSGFVFEPHYPVVLNDGLVYLTSYNKSALVIGTGRGLANSAWPARDHDNKGTRNAAGVAEVAPNPAPSVAITAPTQPTITVEVNEPRTLTALASDAADGLLTSSIRWISSIDGQFGTGGTASLLPLSVGTHTITATVTDSAGLTGSATLTVNKAIIPPVVSIIQPWAESVYDVGQNIPFSGTATDQLDGWLSPVMRWTSDRDGELGIGGGTFQRNNLTVGTHVITASATDSSGATGSATVVVHVEVRGPNINISTPASMGDVELGQPTSFQGNAMDAVDGDKSATMRWVSDRDGLLGTGGSFVVPNLSAGAHVITVTANDNGGTVTTVQLPILVHHLPPIMIYEAPPSGVYPAGVDIQFRANAWDAKDGTIGDNIQWTSSLDGLVGTGQGYFNRNDLSVGAHFITASITDSDGQTAVVQRWVHVVSPDNTAPNIHIGSPNDGSQAYATEPVQLQGVFSDAEDGDGTINWSSSRDGALGSGNSLAVSTLSVGMHTIFATGTDSGGAKAANWVQLEIVPMPANFPAQVTVFGLPPGARYTTLDAFPLGGTAIDREDGNISNRLQWSSDLNGALGSGATVFVSGLAAGIHTVTGRVVDNYGTTATGTNQFEIFPDGASRHLEDTFTNGSVDYGWTVYDDGIPNASSWWVTNGRMVEGSDQQAGDATASALPKPGTYLYQSLGMYWLDYRLEATLRSSDDDALGLMFRYVDNDNYYRFSMDRERSYRRLVRKVNGVFTTLWQDSTRYSLNTNVNVVISAVGSTLTLSINGTQVFTGTDTSHRRGTVALYSWGENQAQFDNVRVYNLRTVNSNDAPVVTITSPANNTSVLVGTVVSLAGTALDFEDGTMSQAIAWSSSRDGALGTGASLNLSTLTVGAHVITASATDSRGANRTATVNLTITEPFNDPPTLSVTSPTEGASFNVGATVNFAGTANDVQDGTISNGISWTSSRNGLLGTGATLSVSSLSAGAHVITARITDSGGKFTTVTRNITVVVPGNTPPVVTVTAPLNGAAFGVGQTVALAATATDTEDGTITNSIAWTSSRNGALGTGGTLNVSTLTGGTHTITATVIDSMGGTHAVTRAISVVPTNATLLRDDFNDNNYTGWTVTNEGTVSAPSAWSASTGALRQTADISSTPTTAATLPKPGTFNRYTSGSAWTNYSVTTELRSSDNDTLGVMFRYTSASNYYRFSMDSERAIRRLTKVRNGTWTSLWSDTTAYQLNRTYVLEIIANGSTITVKLDGVQLWSGTDSNALTTGTIAMYSWMNTGAQFDNVLVRDLAVVFSKATPAPKRKPEPEREPVRVAMLLPTVDLRSRIEGSAP